MTKHQTCRECHYDFVGPDANIGGNLCETCSQEFHSECREQLAEAEDTIKKLQPIVAADDELFAVMAINAFPAADSSPVARQQAHKQAFARCIAARKAANPE